MVGTPRLSTMQVGVQEVSVRFHEAERCGGNMMVAPSALAGDGRAGKTNNGSAPGATRKIGRTRAPSADLILPLRRRIDHRSRS